MENFKNVISVHDYPKTHFSAYWDIFIHSATHVWLARLYAWSGGEVVEHKTGKGSTRDQSRKQSQEWVLSVIEKYRRSDEEIKALTAALGEKKAAVPAQDPEDGIVGQFSADIDDLVIGEGVSIGPGNVGKLKT